MIILLAGVGILLYPSVSDWWNSMHATRAIAGYVTAVEDMSGQEKEAMLEAAKAYNERLANGVNFTLTEEEYEEVVNYARFLGMREVYIQMGGCAEESFIPAFDCRGI